MTFTRRSLWKPLAALFGAAVSAPAIAKEIVREPVEPKVLTGMDIKRMQKRALEAARINWGEEWERSRAYYSGTKLSQEQIDALVEAAHKDNEFHRFNRIKPLHTGGVNQ